MYCLHPINVRKYRELDSPRTIDIIDNKGRKLSRVVKSVKTNEYHLVPCGKCVACLARRRNEFTYRLKQEQNYSSYSFFLTLTYDQNNIPIKVVENKPYFVFNKKNVQDYLKRVRYYFKELNEDLSCSYYLVSEYGKSTLRPHYHMLFFVKNDKYLKYKKCIEQVLKDQWKFGFFVIKPTNDANIHYCTKYCIKNLEELPEQCIDPVFVLASKRPYLGSGAEGTIDSQFNDFEGTEYREPIVFNNGCRSAMPRIYRNKLGLVGLPSTLSDYDPRMTEKQYLQEYQSYVKKFGEQSSLEKFNAYLNHKFKIMERAARFRQLSRSEKL